MNQAQYFFYGFTRNSQNPLDPRYKINSLSTIDSELLLEYRYGGLVFHVTDIDRLYVFLNDLTKPIDFISYINANKIVGIDTSDYTTLLTELNNTLPNAGSLITVFPLKVTFMYNGNNWEYFNGDYNVVDDLEIETIPLTLRKEHKKILMSGVEYLFDATLNKSTPIINVESKPLTPDNNRYYSINGIIFFSYGGLWISLGQKVTQFITKTLDVGDNFVIHNFNSNYNNVEASITNGNDTINLEVTFVDENTSNIKSKLMITGNLLLSSKI